MGLSCSRKPVGELPSHGHSAYTDIQGYHTHALWLRQRHGQNGGGGEAAYGDGDVWGGTVAGYTDNNGGHSHTITINNSGDSQPHNNMMPYISLYIWKRSA